MINIKNNSLNEDQLFTQILLFISKHEDETMNLSSSQPILNYLPPKAIKNLLSLCLHPQNVREDISDSQNLFYTFPSLDCALKHEPSLKVIKARPFEVFLHKDEPYILDLEHLGAAIINRNDLSKKDSTGIHQEVLFPILDYIYSNDVCGENGKWQRFHHELMRVFNSKNLIQQECFIGKYRLKKETQVLESHSILGNKLEDCFEIILPWTFSLSDLKKIKNVIEQEF